MNKWKSRINHDSILFLKASNRYNNGGREYEEAVIYYRVRVFNVSTQWKPGNGATTLLWDHDWGEGQLRFELPNLYSFTQQSDISVQAAANEHNLERMFRPNLSILAQQELSQLIGGLSIETNTEARN